ncbi:hypothetical protein GCM10009628_42750 [Paeniglutamicibacter kerguelensis]
MVAFTQVTPKYLRNHSPMPNPPQKGICERKAPPLRGWGLMRASNGQQLRPAHHLGGRDQGCVALFNDLDPS